MSELRSRCLPGGGWTPIDKPPEDAFATTEATVFAMLALQAESPEWQTGKLAKQSIEWLKTLQRSDGGWAPHAGIPVSTWVTSLVLLLPRNVLVQLNWKPAVECLMRRSGRESGWLQRVRTAMITGRVPDPSPSGWPFYPETAAWVAPTAFSLLCLRKLKATFAASEIPQINEMDARIQDGGTFLLARRCADGGWNHGSSRALGYDSSSYPEMTGIALTALKGWPPASLASSMGMAHKHLSACRSLEATRWLELGLLAQGETVTPKVFPPVTRSRSTTELALDIILSNAVARKKSVFEAGEADA